MDANWSYQILSEEEGMTLGRLLRTKGFSARQLSRLKFRERGIWLDGKKCRTSQPVKTGQRVELFLDDPDGQTAEPCLKEHAGFHILYEDDTVVLVYKPAGIPSHPCHGFWTENAGTWVQEYVSQKGHSGRIRAIGRLDKDTRGLMLYAKNQASAARLWEQREKGIFRKSYHGLILGHLPAMEGDITTLVGGKEAFTHYQVLSSSALLQHVRFNLKSGRTHQIRIHMAGLGCPILEDPLYGGCRDETCRTGMGLKNRPDSLALEADLIRWQHPFTGKEISLGKEPVWDAASLETDPDCFWSFM
ncbi:MAG: RluA family pseudouridine synthase [Blautia sp.]|nr:RluA family pseudouridine synthase [Blautia sp.]